MNKKQFIEKIIGTPYENRAHSFDSCDCFGLVYLYYSEVLGIKFGLTESYLNGDDFHGAFMAQLQRGRWDKIKRPSGEEVVFMMYNRDIPLHCGVMIDSVNCLHSLGNPTTNTGQAVMWTISQVERYLWRVHGLDHTPRVEFYRWAP